jgi:hypothetical protein
MGNTKYVIVPGMIVEGAGMEGAEVAPASAEAGRAEWIKIDPAFNASAVSVCGMCVCVCVCVCLRVCACVCVLCAHSERKRVEERVLFIERTRGGHLQEVREK